MSHQTLAEQAIYRAIAEDSFEDRCNILRVSITTGTYGGTEELVTGTYSVPCGFYMVNQPINEVGEVQFAEYDCVLRLAIGTPFDENDEVELVSRSGNLVSGTFVSAKPMEVGVSVETLYLRRKL